MKHSVFSLGNFPLIPLCLSFLGAAFWPEMELLVPSLPAMKTYFGVTEGQIQQLLSSNFIGFILGVLVVGPLCDSFGRKKITLVGGGLFLLASLIAAMSESFFMLLIARFMQGLFVTGPIIGGAAMLFEVTQGPRQFFWMSMSSAIITLAMAGAPLIGSTITTHFGFQGNLWAIFISGLLGLLPVVFFVTETLPPEKRSPFNATAITRNYFSLLKKRSFMAMIMCVSGLPAAYWVYTGVSSLYLVDYLSIDPALFGSYQGPIVAIFAVLSLMMSAIHQRIGLTACLIAGFIMTFVGAAALLVLAVAGIEHAFFTIVFMMFFVGGMVPVNSLLFPIALTMLPLELRGSGQSMIQALRLTLASIGTFFLGIFYHGPFLPVALVLASMFFICWLLLWIIRASLATQSTPTMTIGH